jgi:Lamin Tail Domain
MGVDRRDLFTHPRATLANHSQVKHFALVRMAHNLPLNNYSYIPMLPFSRFSLWLCLATSSVKVVHGSNSINETAVVITEIMIDPYHVSDTYGEWFELYNNGNASVDLMGWSLSTSSSPEYIINGTAGMILEPGQYIVLGNSNDEAENGGYIPDLVYEHLSFYGTGHLELYDATGTLHDAVAWNSTSNFPVSTGGSIALKTASLDNSIGSNWCESSTVFGLGDKGTPGLPNDCPGYNSTAEPGLESNQTDAPSVSSSTAPVASAPPMRAPSKAPAAPTNATSASLSMASRLTRWLLSTLALIAALSWS